MGSTLRALPSYHTTLALNVSLYHLDPFWWSHEALGGCGKGASAELLEPSPWHFPDGLGSLSRSLSASSRSSSFRRSWLAKPPINPGGFWLPLTATPGSAIARQAPFFGSG